MSWLTAARCVAALSTSQEIRLEGSTLHALTPHIVLPVAEPKEGEMIVLPYGDAKEHLQWVPASFPLDLVLGNLNGKFIWGFKHFSKSARNITLNGTILSAELLAEDGTWNSDSLDLNHMLMGRDGVFTAVDVPALVGVPEV